MPRLVIAVGILTGLFALSLLAKELEVDPTNRVLVPLHGLGSDGSEEAARAALSRIPGVADVQVVQTDTGEAGVIVSMQPGAGLRLSDVSRSLAEAAAELVPDEPCQIDGDALRLVDGTSVAIAGIGDEERLQVLLQEIGSGLEGADVQRHEDKLFARLQVLAGSVVPFMDVVRAVEGGGGQVVDVLFLPAPPPREQAPSHPGRQTPPPPPQGGGG